FSSHRGPHLFGMRKRLTHDASKWSTSTFATAAGRAIPLGSERISLLDLDRDFVTFRVAGLAAREDLQRWGVAEMDAEKRDSLALQIGTYSSKRCALTVAQLRSHAVRHDVCCVFGSVVTLATRRRRNPRLVGGRISD